jgi:Mg2+ and Co2+ transporter CorA
MVIPWFDIEESEPEELRSFLTLFGLHQLVLDHCVGKKTSPGVISYESEILLEVPAMIAITGLISKLGPKDS